MDYLELSKTVSHALRHEPGLYQIRLDDQGWVSLDELIRGLGTVNSKWNDLQEVDFKKMIELSKKKRHEISSGKIRASYGHSFPEKILKSKSVPPEVLYHGTQESKVQLILSSGLSPMKRQYVHLSENIEDAKVVAQRRSGSIVVLKVDSKKANQAGINFYQEKGVIWLSESIPKEYLSVI